MERVLFIIPLLTAMLAAAGAKAQNANPGPAPGSGAHMRATAPTNTALTSLPRATNLSARRNLARELNITTNQMAQVTAAIRAFTLDSRTRAQAPGLTPEQRQLQQEQAARELDAKLQTILTPAQYARIKSPPVHVPAKRPAIPNGTAVAQ